MSKAVLISIRPEWCEKIANCKKTIEVRKTIPKLKPPFKCYIYCTLGEYKGRRSSTRKLELFFGNGTELSNGKVIGEFVCDNIFEIEPNYEIHNELAGSPVEMWYEWDNAPDGYDTAEDIENASCLSLGEIERYLGEDGGYCWHISDLVIYDKPKELGDFKQCHKCCYMGVCNDKCWNPLQRPPQSWCYVEEVTGDG